MAKNLFFFSCKLEMFSLTPVWTVALKSDTGSGNLEIDEKGRGGIKKQWLLRQKFVKMWKRLNDSPLPSLLSFFNIPLSHLWTRSFGLVDFHLTLPNYCMPDAHLAWCQTYFQRRICWLFVHLKCITKNQKYSEIRAGPAGMPRTQILSAIGQLVLQKRLQIQGFPKKTPVSQKSKIFLK